MICTRLWFKTNSDNGAALSQMQLKICYNVGNFADCKLRYVKFRDEDSFWFDTVGDNTNDCHSAGNHCAVMGDLDFKINFNCLEEGKIELTFDAETHVNALTDFSDTKLDLVYPKCA